MKSWYKSKTLWTNIGLIVGGLGAFFTGDPQVSAAGGTAAGTGFANVILRLVTNTGLGK